VKIFESFIIAMKSLTANKLRSSLTMLGVIIGVGSVITLMSVGRGAEASITSSIQGMGTNLISVTSKTPGVQGMMAIANPTYSFTMDDAREIAERVPNVVAVAPVIENYVEVSTASESTLGIVEATTPEFENVLNYPGRGAVYHRKTRGRQGHGGGAGG
jgi:putative ABC transport system permease protein